MGVLLAAALIVPHVSAAGTAAPTLGEKAFSVLRTGLSAEDPDSRALAAKGWGRLGNPAAIKLLKPLLKDPSDPVRVAAAAALHALGDDSGVQTLFVVALRAPSAPKTPAVKAGEPSPEKDEDPFAAAEEMKALARNKVRGAAIRVLAEIRPPALRKALEKLREDRDGGVRDAALLSLGLLGDTVELDRFAEALSSEDPALRARAAAILGEVPSPKVCGLLLPLASDSDPRVRAAVMRGLGLTQSPEAVDALLLGAKDSEDLVRAQAVEALGLVPGESVVPALEEARKTSNAHVELLAVAALARHGESAGVPLAQRALAQSDPDVRLLAVETLETIGGADAVAALEPALEDRELRVRVRAAAALLKLLARPGTGRTP